MLYPETVSKSFGKPSWATPVASKHGSAGAWACDIASLYVREDRYQGCALSAETLMFKAPPFRHIVVDNSDMAQIGEIYDMYLMSLERQAVRFENVASRLKENDKRAVLVFVAGLRKEIQILRQPIEPLALRD